MISFGRIVNIGVFIWRLSIGTLLIHTKYTSVMTILVLVTQSGDTQSDVSFDISFTSEVVAFGTIRDNESCSG